MNIYDWYFILGSFIMGYYAGWYVEARLWRSYGDHEYMNRKESGGKLYQVKREE